MIIINHRVNSIKLLKKTSKDFGVEIDIRTYGKKIIVDHEPFKSSLLFSKWLKHYDHKFLIVNIKEEGIEIEVLKLLQKNSISDYFLLDVTVPQITILHDMNISNIALRVSKYENYQNLFNFKNKNHWIWIDTFNGEIPIKLKDLKKIKKHGFKVCLVSPELPLKIHQYTKKFIIQNHRFIKLIDAVCTKQTNLWKKYED